MFVPTQTKNQINHHNQDTKEIKSINNFPDLIFDEKKEVIPSLQIKNKLHAVFVSQLSVQRIISSFAPESVFISTEGSINISQEKQVISPSSTITLSNLSLIYNRFQHEFINEPYLSGYVVSI